MRFRSTLLPRVVAGLVFGLSVSTHAVSEPYQGLSGTVAGIEERLDARVGLVLIDTGSGQEWSHRADEKFLMNSTVKVPLCGAVLAQSDAGTLVLSEEIQVRDADLIPWAPVTETKVDASMTLSELCLASIDMSDNPAANLLIDRLGGPQAITQFFRSIGDTTSRLDRREPELNTFAPGDPRDTSTPRAMAETLRTLLLGDVLSSDAQAQLAAWMRPGGVTGALLRQYTPEGWAVHDKSGGGEQTRNIIALIAPESRAPWVVAIYLSDADVDFATRNAALQELSAAVVALIEN